MIQWFLCTVNSATNHPSLPDLLSLSPCHQLHHGILISTQDTQMQQGLGIVITRLLLLSSRVSQRWPCSYRFLYIMPSKRHCFILFTALAAVDEFNSLVIFEYFLNLSAHPEV